MKPQGKRGEQPKVTVVIAAYNAASFLHRSLISVLNQDYGPLDVVVVDDASTDLTHQVAADVGDSRVRVVRLADNVGAAAARQVGLEATTAPYVASLDADDEWHPGALRRLVETLNADPAVGLAYAGIRFVDASGEETATYDPRSALDFHDLLAHELVPAQTMVMRRETLVAAGGFDGGWRVAEDWDLCLRMARLSRLRHAGGILATAHLHESSTSRDQTSMVRSTLEVLRHHARAHGVWCSRCRRAQLTTRYEYGRPDLLDAVASVRLHGAREGMPALARAAFRFPDVAVLGLLRTLRGS